MEGEGGGSGKDVTKEKRRKKNKRGRVGRESREGRANEDEDGENGTERTPANKTHHRKSGPIARTLPAKRLFLSSSPPSPLPLRRRRMGRHTRHIGSARTGRRSCERAWTTTSGICNGIPPRPRAGSRGSCRGRKRWRLLLLRSC